MSGSNWNSLSRVDFLEQHFPTEISVMMEVFHISLISGNIFIRRNFLLTTMLLLWASVYIEKTEKLFNSYSLLSAVKIISWFLSILHKWCTLILMCFLLLYVVIICILIYCSYSCWGSNWSILGQRGFIQMKLIMGFQKVKFNKLFTIRNLFFEICAS